MKMVIFTDTEAEIIIYALTFVIGFLVSKIYKGRKATKKLMKKLAWELDRPLRKAVKDTAREMDYVLWHGHDPNGHVCETLEKLEPLAIEKIDDEWFLVTKENVLLTVDDKHTPLIKVFRCPWCDFDLSKH